MASFFSKRKAEPALERPTLELSGEVLSMALEQLSAGCEEAGGIDRFVMALKLRGAAFQDILVDKPIADLTAEELASLTTFMPTVRRRIGPYLEPLLFPKLQSAIEKLLEGAHVPAKADERMAIFCANFPDDKSHRWVRDLAAEILHATDMERYPLMCRWVWSTKSNSGVLREIWHGDVDGVSINIADSYATFVMLREELSQFITSKGVFQEVACYIDLLCAQVYADYVSAQGGSYLRADFSAADDPMAHVRRLLGLDGVKAKLNTEFSNNNAGEISALVEGNQG